MSSITTVNNGDTGATARASINSNFANLNSDKLEATDVSDFETSTELDARDTANRDRANHTGTQTISTISDFETGVNSAINNLFDVNSVALSTTTITLDFSSQRQKIFDTTTAHSANFNIAKDNESNMVLGSYTFETSTTNVVVTLEDGTGGTTEDDMPADQDGWDDVNKQLTLAEAGVYELVYRKRGSKYLVTLSQKF